VQLAWQMINATSVNDSQKLVMGHHDNNELVLGHHHEFVPGVGSVIFQALQTSANLTVSFVNDLLPSLDTSYRLMLYNASQVIITH